MKKSPAFFLLFLHSAAFALVGWGLHQIYVPGAEAVAVGVMLYILILINEIRG